ncbi:interferon alpha-inducible protein 27, mitochondrial-like [Excalfactoria chinensis]|uniref:interferon alpha-inducible protein 27, mitochondrial-like n=1 Tax=Excalfactoria chinensis TaxID=46218 RepID=UPI003B3A4DD9
MAKSRRAAGGDAEIRCHRSSTPGTSSAHIAALTVGRDGHNIGAVPGLWVRCSEVAVRMLQPAVMKLAIKAVVGGGVAAGAAVAGVPLVVWSLGFTAAGITAGSVAAKMMSAAAIANGGGVAAGSTVAVLQSVGAAGLSIGAKLGLASVFGPVGAVIGSVIP